MRVAAIPSGLLIASSLFFFVALSWKGMIEDSPTFDEMVYLPAGYGYLETGDFRINAEQPVLLKLFSALPLLLQEVRLPSSDAWHRGDQWAFGFQFLFQSGNRIGLLLLSGRVMSLFWGMVLVVSIYAVSRDRFGQLGGLVSLLVAASSPLILGNAHYVTMDVMVATLIFLSTMAFERWLELPTLWRAGHVGILVAGAVLAKFSALILLLVLPACAFILYCRTRRARGSRSPSISHPNSRTRGYWTGGGIMLTVFFLVWAAYQFRFGASSGTEAISWDAMHARSTVLAKVVDAARKAQLLPEAYLYGLALVEDHGRRGHDAYALGLHSKSGWWWYFPFAFLVKTPLPALLLVGWGVGSFIQKSGKGSVLGLPSVLVPAVFALVSVFMKLNIGIRYILPLFPFLIVFSGGIGALREVGRTAMRQKLIALGLAAVCVVDGWATSPYHLSYFNWAARLAAARHELLIDSNLDWGQDLGRLSKYMEEHSIPEVKLAYFGSASPAQLGLRHQILPSFNMHSLYETEWPRAQAASPGDVVAVSATTLVGAYMDDKLYYRRMLGGLQPFATIGSSIYLYRIPPLE